MGCIAEETARVNSGSSARAWLGAELAISDDISDAFPARPIFPPHLSI